MAVRFKLHFGVKRVDEPENVIPIIGEFVLPGKDAAVEHSQTYMVFDDAALETLSLVGGGLPGEIIKRAFLHAERFSRDLILKRLSEIIEEERVSEEIS